MDCEWKKKGDRKIKCMGRQAMHECGGEKHGEIEGRDVRLKETEKEEDELEERIEK